MSEKVSYNYSPDYCSIKSLIKSVRIVYQVGIRQGVTDSHQANQREALDLRPYPAFFYGLLFLNSHVILDPENSDMVVLWSSVTSIKQRTCLEQSRWVRD